MTRTYTLDPQAAKEANQGGKRITETGKYKGKIKAAWVETYQTGTEAVCIQFESDNGQEAGPLTLFTFNRDNQPLAGLKMFNAILACMRVRTATPRQGSVTLYDFDQKAEVDKQKPVFQELTGKPIGFLLQQEEYTDKDGYLRVDDTGAPKTRMRINAPFEASTELMAAEVLDRQAQPVALGRAMEYLSANPIRHDRNAKRSMGQSGQYQQQSNGYQAAQNGQWQPPTEEYDSSEIPF